MRIAAILLSCLFLILAAGCEEKNGYADPSENNEAEENQITIDIDFTRLSSTMQNAQLQIVMQNAHDYIGQTMKIRGVYDPYFIEHLEEYLQFIMIDCPTGCPKYLEFIWSGDRVYPDDYPELGTMIELVGVFNIYKLNGFDYPYFAVDDIVIVQ
jgi:hypothetical protein